MKKNSRLNARFSRFRALAKVVAVMAFSLTAFVASAQQTANKPGLENLLPSYYTIKDALVNGNSKLASAGATAFIKNLNGISYNLIPEGNVNTLLKDAGSIANAKSIDKQRGAFVHFSSSMVEVAKSQKLSGQPVYVQYCPMKKASWLSKEKAIQNPYYGSSMLTCGKVTDTIQ